MNNEIGRKLTSLTLMTIMLASAFAVGAPSVLPQAAAANANLFVSAENSQFQNYFAGPQVIEVVVIDSDIKDTDKGKGEPDVTVNGNKLRMAQATDGNWYGYFADRAQAQLADEVQNAVGVKGASTGLDFGSFCSATSASAVVGTSFTQTVGVTFAKKPLSSSEGQATLGTCTATTSQQAGATVNTNVVRENKTLNRGGTGVTIGQIGVTNSYFWPFIQLYNLNPTGNVVIQYNKGGGVQSTTLKFDTVDQFAKLDLDRTSYPRSAQVQATITDIQLNIDPTDEDSWTFGTTSSNATVYYSVFTEDGSFDNSTAAISVALTGNRTNLMFEDNGLMKLDLATQGSTVLARQDNADSVLSARGTVDIGVQTISNQPVTITETAPNTGVFGTYDESDTSVLVTTSDAARGKSATIDYNDSAQTIVIGFGFASVDIKPTDAEWNSGEDIPVTVVDSDANKNSRADEDLDLFNANVALIPSLRIGTPFTLGVKGTDSSTVADSVFLTNFTGSTGVNQRPTNGVASLFAYTYANTRAAGNNGVFEGNMTVNKFSDRAVITTNKTSSVTALLIDTKATAQDLKKTILDPRSGTGFHGFNLLNIDLRGINSSKITNSSVFLVNTTTTIITRQSGASGAEAEITANANLGVNVKLIPVAYNVKPQSLTLLNGTGTVGKAYDLIFGGLSSSVTPGATSRGISSGATDATTKIGYLLNFTRVNQTSSGGIVVDLFSFGYKNDGVVKTDRVNNAIYRIEAEETGDNTSTFEGTLEYVMLNQLNILDSATYTGLDTISSSPKFVVHQDLDDEESPRVNYNDLAADGTVTQVSDQQAAPTHSGVVSFAQPTYKKADTVVVTLEDQDLNTDVDLIDIYTALNSTLNGAQDTAQDTVGKANLPVLSSGDALGRLLDITFDDTRWTDSNRACDTSLRSEGIDTGLFASGFTLVETGAATGIFSGDFIVPGKVCSDSTGQLGTSRNTQGLDMEVNYVDFRDASGQIVEVGDGAGIRANTGSVSLDRTVYPVPFGGLSDFASQSTSSTPNVRSIFPFHLTAITANNGVDIDTDEALTDGTLTAHIQVNDPDFDTSASGEDIIAENTTAAKHGPVKVTISRGNSKVLLAYAGGPAVINGVIDVGADSTNFYAIREIGPITETTPSSGIFEFDLPIEYSDGPANTVCPTTTTWDSLQTPGSRSTTESTRFDVAHTSGSSYCIIQGDIITVEYTDPADASGKVNTVTDSATFDLRNGALQSDKSVYIIGSDMILTLIEPDFDLDNDLAETYDLDLIEWDSDAATVTMGGQSGTSTTEKSGIASAFDPEPSDLRETGDSTGIFQSVIEIPKTLKGDNLERGEEIVLEYTDWGPSGSDYVGDEDEDVNLTIFTSNFGATVELDQKVYSWTDKVYITVVAPDHNFDSNLVDQVGQTSDPLKVATRGHKINNYRLTETGTDTGIFTGEVILIGFTKDVDGDGTNDAPTVGTSLRDTGNGPTDGYLGADNDDGLTVSYEFSEDETVVGSALIRWNIGEVSWLEASYPASGTGVVRVIDPDMNLNPEAVDNFNVDAWSDSDAGGIDLTVTETNEATGIFEGTVFFTTTDDSSGHRLRVAEGDTVTAEYKDRTLPDPYTTADELDITGTAFIGTVVPPLERAPASNARVVDAFGNTLDDVSVDQQVQITADLTNGQDREQPFAYLVQVQDENGVTVSLAWITGSLSAGQSFSPALSWIATAPGTYTATVFVWESVDNPTALSPPVSVDITVS